MALGEAEAIFKATGSRVLIVDLQGKPRWSEVWEHHPAIARTEAEPHRVRLVNCPNARPYLKAWAYVDGNPVSVFSKWRAQNCIGRLALTPREAALGEELLAKVGPYAVIEPHIGPCSSPNKDWGFDRFQEVVRMTPEMRWVQLGGDSRSLEGVDRVKTASFREACGVLSRAQVFLSPEGGLHHAAAALNRPGVVIFGGFTSPENTGYPMHINLYVQDHHAPCGRWVPCDGCRQAMERIRPEEVSRALGALVAAGQDHKQSAKRGS